MLGEHTVLHGSAAYAVPLRRYSARIALRNSTPDEYQLPIKEGIHASFDFQKWLAFAKTSEVLAGKLDFDLWEKEAHELGVYADIPIGYGLGSSGAITAEAYRRYMLQEVPNPTLLRKQLAALECFFHGESSGLDPLVSFLNQAIYVSPSGEIETIAVKHSFPVPSPGGAWFLIDSGQPRAGKDAITRFGESCKVKQWQREVLKPMNCLVEELAQGLKSAKMHGLTPKLKALSALQLAELAFLIPSHIARRWEEWLKNETAYLKLCGAGGGGFFLGYAPQKSNLTEEVIWL